MKWFKALVYLAVMAGVFDVFVRSLGLTDGRGFAHWAYFWDLPSAMFVAAGALSALAVFKLSDLVFALQDALGMSETAVFAARSARSLLVLRGVGALLLLAGGSCTLMGVVQALGNLDSMRDLGLAMALSLLSLIYALVLRYLVLFPLEIALLRRQYQSDAEALV